MTSATTRLPLFEKDHNEATASSTTTRIPDTFEDDVELSLTRKGSMKKAWGNTAGRMFVKAKAGVDALRNNRSQQLQGEERSSTPAMRGGAESVMKGPPPRASTGMAHSGLRATASLNRVLDTARRATKKNSLFSSTGITNASSASEPPKGPEMYDAGSSRSSHSFKRPSLSFIRQWTKSPSSKHSSPLSRLARDSIEAVRCSNDSDRSRSTMSQHSPGAATRYSPPPSLSCDLQLTDFFDSQLMEAVGLSQIEFAASLSGSSDSLNSAPASASPHNEGEDQHEHQVYLPSRNTNDHWRTSKARITSLNSTHRVPSTPSASDDEPMTTDSLLNLNKLLSRDVDVDSQHDKENQNTLDRSTTELRDKFYDVKPSSTQAEGDRSREVIEAHLDLDSRAEPATDSMSPRSSIQDRAAKGARKSSKTHMSRLPATTPPARTGANERGSPVKRIRIDVSRTPSPGKPLRLPLRTRRSARSSSEQSPILREGPDTSAGAQRLDNVHQTRSRSAVSSSEDVASPLITQDLFASEAEDDTTAYALGLNDLVEKATRGDPGLSVEAQVVSARAVAGTSAPKSVALQTLSDLKHLNTFREQLARESSPFLALQKSSDKMRETFELEREAVNTVFPVIDPAISDEVQTNAHDADLTAPQSVIAQDQRLEVRVDELFPAGVPGSRDLSQGADPEASCKVRATSTAAESADSASTGSGCHICGGFDDHLCQVLSPSMVNSLSAASVSSADHESACPEPAQISSRIEFRSIENRRECMSGSKLESIPGSPSKSPSKDSTCSLQRKKSDPLGLELHRLGDQAAEWLQSLTGEGVQRYIPTMMRGAGQDRIPLSWMRRSPQSRARLGKSSEKSFNIQESIDDKENQVGGQAGKAVPGAFDGKAGIGKDEEDENDGSVLHGH